MEDHILTSRLVKTARIDHQYQGPNSCAPWETNHPMCKILCRINCKPALMVSSEVTEPDVITLLSKAEAWSSVVRSSEEPGGGRQMD